jgi:Ser/Thr protein kinase RdoA (MazF antagonist)
LLDETISYYRSLYVKYNLKDFLQLTDWLDSHKGEISVRLAVVHQDFHANNVLLCSEDRVFVIDWTQFAISDYRIDLCWALLIMGDLGNPAWGRQIWDAYASHAQHTIEQIDYFHVLVYMKLLGSTMISFISSPEELGLRQETVKVTKEQLSVYKQLSQRIRITTGIHLLELKDVLEKLSEGTDHN